MRKKILSIAMAMAMVFGLGAMLPKTYPSNVTIRSSAAAAKTTLAELRKKYPAGMTWTGPYYISNWEFRRCIGYAAMIANEMYGSFFINWQHDTNMSNLKAGDVILTKYTTKYNGDGHNHAVVVIKVSGDNVIITDCNANNDNKIHWDTVKTKSYFSSTANWNNGINGVYHAPVEAPQENTTPAPAHSNEANIKEGRYNLVNVGTNFYMNYAWGTSDSPIWMSTADGSPEQIFTLEHVGNGKYEMHINHSDGGVVNVYSSSPNVGDKITRYNDNNNDTQRFYITPVGNDEYIIQNAANPNAVVGVPNKEFHTQLALCSYSSSNALIRWKLTPLDSKPVEPEPETTAVTLMFSGGGGTALTDGHVQIGNGSSVYVFDFEEDQLKADLIEGNYTIETNKEGYITRDASIEVAALDFTVYIEIHHPGDINGDSLIDIDDALMVINNVNGVKAIEDDYDRKVANVADEDFSGEIDIEDAVAIINHINGVSPLY